MNADQPLCKTCVYSKPFFMHQGLYGGEEKNTCHVNPPVLEGFPLVGLDDFCGLHEEVPR